MRHIVVVEPTRPQVLVWSRGGEADSDWTPEEIVGVEGVIRLDAVAIELPLAELYDRLSFPS